MEDNRNILGILSSAVGEYLSMRTDDFRKNIITGLSTGFSRVLVILVIALLLLIVLGVLAFGFIVLLGTLNDFTSSSSVRHIFRRFS